MKKVLLVDDDPAIVDAVSSVLEMYDYEVLTAEDKEAVKAVELQKPDVMLLDIWMDNVDGTEICKQVKARKELASTPVVMLSASKDVESESKKAGADDFLAKPFDLDDLIGLVEKYTNKQVNN